MEEKKSGKSQYEKLLLREEQIDKELKNWEVKSNPAYEMKLLHKYNEVKDAAQILLGVIGNVEGVTVKELHERFNLPLTD